jgi:hypothetical protein
METLVTEAQAEFAARPPVSPKTSFPAPSKKAEKINLGE